MGKHAWTFWIKSPLIDQGVRWIYQEGLSKYSLDSPLGDGITSKELFEDRLVLAGYLAEFGQHLGADRIGQN